MTGRVTGRYRKSSNRANAQSFDRCKGQRSRSPSLTKRIATSGNEIGHMEVTNVVAKKRKASSDSMILRAMKSHTNQPTVRGRPKLKIVKRFRSGSVCKAYERSNGETEN